MLQSTAPGAIRLRPALAAGLLILLELLLATTPAAGAALRPRHPDPRPTSGSVAATPTAGRPPAAGGAGRASALRNEAWALFVKGSAEARNQALERLAAARTLALQANDQELLAQLWQMEGLMLFALSRYDAANQAYGKALEIHGRLNQPLQQAQLRLSLAMGHLNLGAYGPARQALALVKTEAQRRGETRLLISALELESQLDARTGRGEAAIRTLKQALALATRSKDREQHLRILDSMAMVLLPLGQLADVRRLIEQRRALAPNDTSLAESVLRTLETRSRPEDLESPASLDERIRRFREAGDLTNTATSLESLATVELNRGRLRRGLALYQEALDLFEQQGMRGRAASAMRNVGQTLAALGDYGRSLEVTGRALQLARAVGEDAVQIQCLLDLADLQQTLGHLNQAASNLEAALSLASSRRDHFRQAQALTGLADLRRREQKLQEAAALARRALATARQSGMPLLETSALSTLVRAHESLGELEPAMEAAQRITAISRSSGDRWIGATGAALRGRVLLAMGRPSEALDALSQGIAVFRAQQQIPALIANLDLQARALSALDRLGPAMETYREQERLCAEMGDPRCQAAVLFQQSQLNGRQGHLEDALEQIRRSLSITENLRSSLPSTDLRQSYFAQVQDHYDWCIELLLRLHRLQPTRRFDLQALEVSERARARGLVELLTVAHAEAGSGIDPALLTQRRALDGRIRELLAGRQRLRQPGSNREEGASALADLEVRLADLQQQQQQLEQELRRSSPRYADLLLPRSLDAAAIQALLDDETLLLEIHLGEKQGVLWLIDRQGVETHGLPGRAEIHRLVARFHAERHRNQADPSPAATGLSRLLLDPLAARLGTRRLAIVPHGSLFYFPFAALPSPGNGRPLVESHELVSLPSASTLAALRRGPSGPSRGSASLLLLADPVFSPSDPRLSGSGQAGTGPSTVAVVRDGQGSMWQRLPGTAMEAAAIRSLLPAGSSQRSDEGFSANRQTLLGMDLRPYRWLHIATHGKADGAYPEQSRLVLSLLGRDGRPIDGDVRLQDIYNLRLSADLVVLSACQSGLGPLVRGEGLVSLTRGFLYAGSQRVLASLWNVDDRGTALLMDRFYRSLMVDRLTPAAALRQAQRALLADPRWRSTDHWAAFTLHGDWR